MGTCSSYDVKHADYGSLIHRNCRPVRTFSCDVMPNVTRDPAFRMSRHPPGVSSCGKQLHVAGLEERLMRTLKWMATVVLCLAATHPVEMAAQEPAWNAAIKECDRACLVGIMDGS